MSGPSRRAFLRGGAATALGLTVGDALWRSVLAAPAQDAEDPYDGLGPPDALGMRIQEGHIYRTVARANLPVLGPNGAPVGDPGHVYPIFPDGSHCFPVDPANPTTSGWVLVVNSENPPGADFPFAPDVQNLGGASAIRFGADGAIEDAYWVLRDTRTNCAGGATPWGTWLSGEEFDDTTHPGADNFAPASQAGRVWECHPLDRDLSDVRVLAQLGHFKHEAAAFDELGRVYLTEDRGDGLLYRFIPDADANQPASLTSGALQAAVQTGSTISWVDIDDPTCATGVPTRVQGAAAGATTFDGGEGCWFAPHASGTGGRVYITTKGDDMVRALDTATDQIEVVYDSSIGGRILNGVDNIIVSPHTGNVYVAEDGDDMQIIVIENVLSENPTARVFAHATGPQHGRSTEGSPIPTASEITGLAISPDGKRLYFSSQRAYVFGETYEISSPTLL